MVVKTGIDHDGGAGSDTFVFNSSFVTLPNVTDCAVGTDHLQISASGSAKG